MSQIIEQVRKLDTNDFDTAKGVLSTFFQYLSKPENAKSTLWLQTLEFIITKFPKLCMVHRNTIEAHLANFLDCKSYGLVVLAAKCSHALLQVRPAQDKSATAKSSWRNQLALLSQAAHMLIEAAFPAAVDIYKSGGYFKKSVPENIDPDSPLTSLLLKSNVILKKGDNYKGDSRQTMLCTRLANVFIFLQAMLVEIYPVAKPVQPQIVLDVVVQALSSTNHAQEHNENQKHKASTVDIKIQALRTIDALVTCLGPNLIPYSPLVFRLIMQTIRWTSENPSEEARNIRCRAYSSLCLWLTRLHCHKLESQQTIGRGKCMEDELVTTILDDITPIRQIVQLTMSNNSTRNLSKKAKRKMANTMLRESGIANHMPGGKNKELISKEDDDVVATAALECLEVVLTVCGIFLKPSTHKSVQERLVQECYALNNYNPLRALALCRTLESCRRGVPAGVPAPTQHCLQVYSMHTHSPHPELSMFCSQSLLALRLSLHCSPPTLCYSLDVQPEKQKKPDENKNVVSQRNRAALESLLGSDRFSSISNDKTEVITIPDEPSYKKRKVDGDSIDEVSVSSQSSMEINIIEDQNGGVTSEDDIEIQEDAVITSTDKINTIQKDLTAKQIINEADSSQICNGNLGIHELKTQLPVSHDTIDAVEDTSQHSVEITYDSPSAPRKVTVIEKGDDENLPSTNDTDDIQITCGQTLKSSMEVNEKGLKSLDDKSETTKPAVDDIIHIADEQTEINAKASGIQNPDIEIVEILDETAPGELAVEDMLADFVDEVA